MKLYSIYTEETKCLKDIFVKTMKDKWELNLIYMGKAVNGRSNFGTPEFVSLMRQRLGLIIDSIKKNYGQTIIWADIDIQFFGKCSGLIEEAMAHNDIVFQAEWTGNKWVNPGFVVMKCNDKTMGLFEHVAKEKFETLPLYEQSAINNFLEQNMTGLVWDVLPKQFWARSHYPKRLPTVDIVLHHANTTIAKKSKDGRIIESVELKLEQLKAIRKFIIGGRRKKLVKRIENKMRNIIKRVSSLLSSG